jgi:hypothetical protein
MPKSKRNKVGELRGEGLRGRLTAAAARRLEMAAIRRRLRRRRPQQPDSQPCQA